MTILYNSVYIIAWIILAPFLLYKSLTTGKYRRGLWRKLTGRILPEPLPPHPGETVWFHGVSVGEIVMLQTVVASFRRAYPKSRCVISTTTDTGYDEARKRFADLIVVYWPFDFSWAVRNALSLIRPNCVVLAESEIWPNFMRIAQRQDVRLALINGRMSPKSARRFAKLRWLVGGSFGRLDLCAVQTEEIGRNFAAAGVPTGNIVVTGSVKYDGAQSDRGNPRTQELRQLLEIADDDLVWVAGSTQTPEEQIVLDIYQRIRSRHPSLRLIIVPRQQDRFDEVAKLLQHSNVAFVRRSQLGAARAAGGSPVVLVDTIGELGAIWGLADIAFVGGSLDGKRGGQNMIEPAAYGAAVLFGPHNWNFRQPVRLLLEGNAAIQIADAEHLEREMEQLLTDASSRSRLGTAARRLVASQQGATQRTVEALGYILECEQYARDAA